MYSRCNDCDQIIPPDGLCSFCGGSKRSSYPWPSPEAGALLLHALGLDPRAPHSRRIAVIFVAAAFEDIMTEQLHVMAFGELLYDEAGLIVQALIDGYEGRNRQLTLYRKIGCDSFANEAKTHGFPSFAKDWETVAQERNSLAHGRTDHGAKSKGKVDLQTFVASGLKLFAALHNDYNTASTTYKSAVACSSRKRQA